MLARAAATVRAGILILPMFCHNRTQVGGGLAESLPLHQSEFRKHAHIKNKNGDWMEASEEVRKAERRRVCQISNDDILESL